MARESRAGMGLVDRLVLLVAWIATCGLVYLLGFYVGKGMQEKRLGLEERVVRLPVTSAPPPEGRREKSGAEFGFYDKLMGQPSDRGTMPGAASTAHDTRPAAAPSPAVEASKPAVAPDAAKTPVPPAVAKAPTGAPPAPVPVAKVAAPASPSTPAVVPAKPAPAAPPTPTAVATKPTPAPAAVARVPAASPAAVADVPPPTPRAANPPASAGGWTVLANPTRSHDEADGLVRQLKGRGYEATLVRVVRDGDTWYRVQIGRFATSEQATELMRRLREHEGVSHVFVASE